MNAFTVLVTPFSERQVKCYFAKKNQISLICLNGAFLIHVS